MVKYWTLEAMVKQNNAKKLTENNDVFFVKMIRCNYNSAMQYFWEPQIMKMLNFLKSRNNDE
jgi:hypothetical protein